MSTQDSYTVGEFAKRYKVRDKVLSQLCQDYGLTTESVLNREEFRSMFVEFSEKRAQATELASRAKEHVKSNKDNSPHQGKEEEVKNEEKIPFERLAKARKLTPAKRALLCSAMGWQAKTLITESEFKSAINKHLFNRT